MQGLLQYYDDLCQEVPSVFVNLMTPKMKKVGDAEGFTFDFPRFKIRFLLCRGLISEHISLP